MITCNIVLSRHAQKWVWDTGIWIILRRSRWTWSQVLFHLTPQYLVFNNLGMPNSHLNLALRTPWDHSKCTVSIAHNPIMIMLSARWWCSLQEELSKADTVVNYSSSSDGFFFFPLEIQFENPHLCWCFPWKMVIPNFWLTKWRKWYAIGYYGIGKRRSMKRAIVDGGG